MTNQSRGARQDIPGRFEIATAALLPPRDDSAMVH